MHSETGVNLEVFEERIITEFTQFWLPIEPDFVNISANAIMLVSRSTTITIISHRKMGEVLQALCAW